MKGADEYYNLFSGKSQQIGRLYLDFRNHARGKCFEMYLLPEGVEVKGYNASRKDSVLLYGKTGGCSGWTETYGWLHKGKWQEDFKAIVEKKKRESDDLKVNNNKRNLEEVKRERDRVQSLLSTY